MSDQRPTVRIAIASDDGASVRKAHFGAASGYEIYELSGGGPRHVERRGPVPDKEGHGPQEALAVIRHLADCEVFVGGSMGRRSRELLLERGITALVVESGTVDEALARVFEDWKAGAIPRRPDPR